MLFWGVVSDKLHPQFELTSITQLEQELGLRRSRLMQLQTDRDREQERLKRAREQYTALEREIKELNASVGAKNQQIFVLVDEVDWMLRLQERVHERARELAKAAGASATDSARVHPRKALAVEVSLQSETNFYVGFSQNISAGGLFVATYDTRPVGERFPVEFELPGRNEVLRCLAEVAWVREYRENDDLGKQGIVPGMGLRFVGLSEEQQTAIAGFLDEREPLFFPEFDELA